MNAAEVDRALTESETALAQGGAVDLARTGFWRAVSAAKRDRSIIEPYGERIARIDRVAFERRVWLRIPAPIGVALDVTGTCAGILLIAIASGRPTPGTETPFWALAPWREMVFLLGVAAIMGATHTLAHWLVGSVSGIRFTHWFAMPTRPQPGFKIDYASYLRTPARGRAWMHASGAIVTKIIPFAAYPVALLAGLEPWAPWLLLGLGVVQLITDATLSTRYSDWKKFRREMRFAR